METLSSNESLEEVLRKDDIVRLVQELFSIVKKTRRSNEEIEKNLWRRSIKEVLASWETFYMWSCIDITLAFLQLLKEKNYPVDQLKLWYEELTWRRNNFRSLHMFLQDRSWDGPWNIDFERDWSILVYHWPYRNRRDWSSLDQECLTFLPASEISGDDSLVTIFEKLGRNWEIFLTFIKYLQAQNTEENYNSYLKTRKPLLINFEGDYVFPNLKNNSFTTSKRISKVLRETPEAKEELLRIMNEMWGIIWHLFWAPYWIVTGVERAIASETDPTLEAKTRGSFFDATHEELEAAYGVSDTIHKTFINLKSWLTIPLTEWRKWQLDTWNSWQSILNYVDRTLARKNPLAAQRFKELWFQLQAVGKKGNSDFVEKSISSEPKEGESENKSSEKYVYKYDWD